MIKHIGMVGCSAEGAALCYTTICTEAQDLMGRYMHPEVTIHTHPLAEYMEYIYAGDWKSVANLMLSSTRKVAQVGADFAICPDNTIHQAFEYVENKSPIPWLHIAEEVAKEAQQHGYSHLGLLGTKYLMTGPVYPESLKEYDITIEIPNEDNRNHINDVIFNELVNGVFREHSRLYFNMMIQEFKEMGCQAAILGCTEIPLLVNPDDCPLPTLDSTRILARAAIKEAI